MRQRAGLTLIEVVIAIAVMAIGIIAAAQMQASSLQNTALAQALNEVTRTVRAELELQRHTATINSDLEEGEAAEPVDTVEFDCLNPLAAGIGACTVVVEPCTIALTPSASLICGSGVLSPPAYRITVDAEGRRGVSLSVSTLATGMYIAGAGGGN